MTSDYVYRGGSWNYYSDYCRSANRLGHTPVYRHYDLGFRVLRSSEVDNKFQVIRGGSWINISDYCRSADRNWNTPVNRNRRLGFRVLRSSREAEEEVKCRKEFLVVRGGGWLNYSKDCRSATNCWGVTPANRIDYLGFRVIKDTDV
jgi:formylglycine-generating enzyme required for sulfatase activity